MYFSEERDFRWYGDFKSRVLQGGVYVYLYEVEYMEDEKLVTRTEMGDVTMVR